MIIVGRSINDIVSTSDSDQEEEEEEEEDQKSSSNDQPTNEEEDQTKDGEEVNKQEILRYSVLCDLNLLYFYCYGGLLM